MREKADPGSTKRQEQRQEAPLPNPREEAQQRAWWARGVLNIQEGVPWEAVKKQHRTLSAQYHPDNKSTGDEQRFKDIQTAYDTLKLIYGEN
jgi:preprotein translocase subunit Sec63